MKKRLLLVLTIVMLMVVAAFSASAADCGDGNHISATKKVAPDCVNRGYDLHYCAACGKEFSKGNYVAALGHDMENKYVAAGSYYQNRQTCKRAGCNVEDKVEQVGGQDVKYYSVQFINAKATDSYLETYKGVGVKHAKLTGVWYNQALNSVAYVKEGGSYTYDGKKPTRNKDVNYGKYIFTGWTDSADNDTNKGAKLGSADNYNVTVKDIRSNTTYYACWQGEVVSYRIQFVNEDGSSWISANNGEVYVAHGQTINYNWIYPSKDSTTSSDFKFAGWVCGNPSKTDAEGNFTEYDEYLLKDGIHIKNVPIFSADAMKATYDAISREYVVEFDLKNGNAPFRKNDVAYGTPLNLYMNEDGKSYTLTLDGANYNVPATYTDSTYTYLFEGGFETTTGYKISNHIFSVPQYTLDNNDSIFLVYATDTDAKVQADGKDMVLVKEIYDELRDFRNPNEKYDYTKKTLFECFNEELNYFNNCKNNVLPYTPKYFNLNATTYLFLKSEHGDLLVDEKGNLVTLEISLNGIRRTYITGERTSFTEADANALRVTKLEPSYRSVVTKNQIVFEIIMPVKIDGKEVEDSPAYFNDLLTVQVKNQNGKLIGRATTGNSNKKEHEAFNFTDNRGNEYRKFFCVMNLEKAEKYEIVVASNDGRNKYEGTRTLFWSTYESTHKNGTPVTVDLSVSADYNQGLNCYCLCHGPLKGLWARILNILYSLFKMQHECCPHMHAEIGDILAY